MEEWMGRLNYRTGPFRPQPGVQKIMQILFTSGHEKLLKKHLSMAASVRTRKVTHKLY